MSSLSVYNTLTRQKEIFVPIDPNNVRMYVCGPTVYDFAHIGNARPVVVFDVLYRLLKRHYKNVTYVRNITDVDDKIIRRAKESNEPINKITTRTTQAYHDDMAALNALSPDHEPRCTDHIPHMITFISDLLSKGHAYTADQHVLFSVPSMLEYGQLSRRSRDELVAGARVEVAPYKKDAADFVLWKPSSPEQPGWDSPWGRGRPGWHIECSAMAKEHLGITFDIHGGGLDLIFPHHENEIAQSRSAHDGRQLANYWMHNGFLTINNDKMSKSLGNFFTVHELLKQYQGEVIRLVLLNAHYRQPLDFSSQALDDAKATLDRWYGALRSTATIKSEKVLPPSKFENSLLDDLNTPLAISQIHELVSDLNRAHDASEHAFLKSQLLAVGDSLGFLQQNPEIWFRGIEQNKFGLSDSDIEEKIKDRLHARQTKNFAEADRLRNILASQGIILEDSPEGTSWRRS